MSTVIDPDERRIWWLASYPKSGSTWARMFLNCYITGFPLDLNSAYQYILGDTYLPYVQTATIRPANQLTVKEQTYCRTAVLMNMLNMAPTKDICLKTHHARVNVDDMPLIPPKISKKVVYLVRDPRDVVISLADHMGTSIDESIEFMGNIKSAGTHKDTHMVHILLTWSKHIESWTDHNTVIPYTIIRYEDMLEDTEESFIKILNGFGISAIRKDKFDFALEQTEFSRLKKLEQEFGFKEKGEGECFFRVGKKEQWKTALTEEQIKTIETDHAEYMAKYDYEPALVKA